MSDFNSVDDLVEELENVIDETLAEDSTNVGFMDDLGNVPQELYISSRLEDDLEGSLVGGATNVSDFTEASSSQVTNLDQLGGSNQILQLESKDFRNKTDKDSNEHQDVDDIELGRNLARRGIFSSDELTDETLFTTNAKTQDYHRTRRFQSHDANAKDLNDPGLTDKHCILRLPEYAAELIKGRLERNEPLGMNVSPTGRYDYREYKITIKGLDNPLYAILGELPCVIEAHKTLNNDLLFKSADISQLMIAYEKEEAENVAETLKNKMWEWPDGITPGTKNIRKKRFKNFDMYTNEEIKEAERESLILMNGLERDTYHYEIKTAQEVNELVQNYRNGNIKERVIGPDEDVSVYINALQEHETEDFPDLSEIMFDSDFSSIPNKFIYNNIKNRIFNK